MLDHSQVASYVVFMPHKFWCPSATDTIGREELRTHVPKQRNLFSSGEQLRSWGSERVSECE